MSERPWYELERQQTIQEHAMRYGLRLHPWIHHPMVADWRILAMPPMEDLMDDLMTDDEVVP